VDEQTIESSTGSIVLYSPAPGVFASRVRGSMGMVQADAYIAFGDAVLAAHTPGIGLHDWAAMTGYASGVRMKVTSWAVRVIGRFEAIHIHTESRVVRMGVAVANMGLAGKIAVHAERTGFDAVSERLLASRVRR